MDVAVHEPGQVVSQTAATISRSADQHQGHWPLKLAKVFGLEFTPTPNGQEMHGVVTHLIDQDGRPRARFHGLNFKPVNLVLFVNALTNRIQAPPREESPSLWKRVKELL